MRKLFSAAALFVLIMPSAYAQTSYEDSIKNEMNKIELLNGSMKQTIDKYKKAVIKGDAESMALLGVECMNGKNVKSNITIGLNLLETAALQDNVEGQYNLGYYFFVFWAQKPDNASYFRTGTRWLKKAAGAGDQRALVCLARFYMEYGRYNKENSYVDGSIKLLEDMESIDKVDDKNTTILDAQAMLGTANLYKWHTDNDTTALRDAKKWYRTLLTSKLEYPNYNTYIDSLKYVMSQGVPLRIDAMPDAETIEKSRSGGGGFGGFGGGGFPGGGGGFPGGGFPGGGFPGGGGNPQGGTPGPQTIQAAFPGGMMSMQSFIRNNTNYPKDLEDNRVRGNATVSFTIAPDGSIMNPTVTRESDVHLINQEALRTIMVMPDWIPAEREGQAVEGRSQASVNFGGGGGGGMGGFGF